MPQLFTLPQPVPLSSLGAILPGAKLYFFQTGTSTPQNVYQDIDLTVAHSQPVVADGAGVFAPIYLNGAAPAYRARLTDAHDAQLWQIDNIPSSNNLAQTFRLKGDTVDLIFEETDAAADNKKSRIRVSSTEILWQLLNDAESLSTDIVRVSRSGMGINAILLDGEPPLIGPFTWKKSVQTRNSTTTLADDSALKLTLQARTYVIEGQIFFDAGATAPGMGIKLGFAYTGSLSDQNDASVLSYVNASGAITQAPMTAASPLVFATLATTNRSNNIRFTKTIRCSTPGVYSLQWAQNTSNADNLNVQVYSWLAARQFP